MNKPARFPLALLLIAALTGCGAPRREQSDAAPRQPPRKEVVTVFAAASTANALDEITAAFAQGTGVEVQANYAASSALAQQIESGADADLFLSADTAWADHVAGKVPVARRRNLLGNRLVIVVPSDSKLQLAKPEDLLSADVPHLALGDPDAVPAGKYAKRALSELGIWEKLKGKIAPAEDVRHALTYVETGAAEAGIVYATDAAVSRKVRVAVELPADMTGPVRYPLILLNQEAKHGPAAAFYDYLGSPAATKVFEKHGFVVLVDGEDGAK
jgi:molybdate transport system substrate-binding protein